MNLNPKSRLVSFFLYAAIWPIGPLLLIRCWRDSFNHCCGDNGSFNHWAHSMLGFGNCDWRPLHV